MGFFQTNSCEQTVEKPVFEQNDWLMGIFGVSGLSPTFRKS